MLTLAQILAFAGVVLLGAVNPGLDFTIVVRHAATRGRRGGMATALGIATGVFVWACAAATGAAALIAASTIGFTVIKLVGAAYLIYLGGRALRAAIRRGGTARDVIDAEARPTSAFTGFRQGLTCNLFNPKVAVFFVALMPQFLGSAPSAGTTLMLGALAAAITLAWFTVVANIVGVLRRQFAKVRVRRAMDAVTGTALVALGVGVAVSRT